jgi:hypothetical protein
MPKDKHELEGMTKDELVGYADSMNVDVQHSWLKEDIVSAILKGQKAAARSKPKEAEMGDEVEVKPVKVMGTINIKGVNYEAGDEVMLTEEEVATLTELGAPIEGVEPMDEEAIQAAHDEGVEAQKARIEADAKAEEEAKAEAKAKANA